MLPISPYDSSYMDTSLESSQAQPGPSRPGQQSYDELLKERSPSPPLGGLDGDDEITVRLAKDVTSFPSGFKYETHATLASVLPLAPTIHTHGTNDEYRPSFRQTMPAAPEASASSMKAPEVKGAVPAKSGCYTCRIRRTKCDERPDEHGQCETCVRLKLQCLGFGANRPDWLGESNATDLREKIKNFLASQGMIKGHSGPSQRPATNRPEEPQEERATLRLDAEGQFPKTGSESPPTGNLV